MEGVKEVWRCRRVRYGRGREGRETKRHFKVEGGVWACTRVDCIHYYISFTELIDLDEGALSVTTSSSRLEKMLESVTCCLAVLLEQSLATR